jgi:hypothetical protein
MTTATTTWAGWLWLPSSGWKKVCVGGSLAECSRELGRIGETMGVPAKHQTMTGGLAPKFTPAMKVQKNF